MGHYWVDPNNDLMSSGPYTVGQEWDIIGSTQIMMWLTVINIV